MKHNSIVSYENDALKGGSVVTHQAVVNAHFGNLEGVSLNRKNTNKSFGKQRATSIDKESENTQGDY